MEPKSTAADAARPCVPAADEKPRLQMLFGFGGAKARYKNHPGRVLRCLDPFTGRLEAFKSPLKLENWLLRRFDPSVTALDASGAAWAVLAAGKLIEIKPHLVWSRGGQGRTLEIVEEPGRGVSAQLAGELKMVAKLHQAAWSIRGPGEIRDSLRLLELLDRVRQCMALHYIDLREEPWTQRLAEHIRAQGQCSRRELLAEFMPRFAGCTEQLVDSAVFWLRQYRHVAFDIHGGAYGDATVISC